MQQQRRRRRRPLRPLGRLPWRLTPYRAFRALTKKRNTVVKRSHIIIHNNVIIANRSRRKSCIASAKRRPKIQPSWKQPSILPWMPCAQSPCRTIKTRMAMFRLFSFLRFEIAMPPCRLLAMPENCCGLCACLAKCAKRRICNNDCTALIAHCDTFTIS